MNLVVVLKDLFIAGAETTSTTLLWSVLYLTMYPEVQRKVQAEIDALIGRERRPSRNDKAGYDKNSMFFRFWN
jgi:cytochrome P450